MAKDFFYPGSLLGIHRKAAEKLLSAGNPDAALLYLAFLTGKDGSVLGWDRERLDKAHALLLELGLADPRRPAVEPPPPKLEDASLPVYSNQDVQKVMEENVTFSRLVHEVEQLLGKGLVTQDVKDLLYLTDYLGLPAEVVFLLTRHCVSSRRPGSRVTLRQLKQEGLRWQQAGAVTLEEADAYLARQALRQDRHRVLLGLLDRPGRAPIKQEASYLDQWIEWGFDDEVIRDAYERTVFQVGDLRWSYLNGILRSWHEQGLHTAQEVQAAEARHRKSSPAPSRERSAPPQRPRVDQGDLDWLLSELNGTKEG